MIGFHIIQIVPILIALHRQRRKRFVQIANLILSLRLPSLVLGFLGLVLRGFRFLG